MVLDNSSSSSEADAFNENDSPDDSDAYSNPSQKGGVSSYSIDVSKLAKPMPIFGYSQDKFQLLLRAKIQNAQNVLARSPTQEEAEAMAFWTAKQLQIISFGLPIGTAGGVWRAYTTRETLRFPFWQPSLEKYKATDGSFRFIGLSGNRATMVFHVFRTMAYCGIGQFIGEILFGSYAASVGAVGELGDKRLKTYMTAIRRKSHEKRGAISNSASSPSTSNQIPSPGGASEQSIDEQEARQLAGGYYSQGSSDDASSMSDSPPVQPPISRVSAQYNESKHDTARTPFQYDDADANDREGVRDDVAQGGGSGSAWDRIRKGANLSTRPNATKEQPTQRESAWSKRQTIAKATPEDSFSFSKSDEERSFAHQEAQKEFDAKVERERRGGDFSSKGDDQRRRQ